MKAGDTVYEHNCAYARPGVRDENVPLFIYGLAFDYTHIKEIDREQGFPLMQLHQCTAGAGRIEINSSEYTIEPGDAMILPPGIPHRYYPLENPWNMDWITFSGSCCAQIAQGFGLTEFALYKGRASSEIHSKIKEVVGIYHKRGANRVLMASPLSYEILTLAKRLSERESRLSPVLRYIDANTGKDMTLEELASVAGISEFHLCRLFRSELSMRPTEYINRTRIQLSKELLADMSLSITETAQRCGFRSENYFRDIFRRFTGTSPSEYRKLYYSG